MSIERQIAEDVCSSCADGVDIGDIVDDGVDIGDVVDLTASTHLNVVERWTNVRPYAAGFATSPSIRIQTRASDDEKNKVI